MQWDNDLSLWLIKEERLGTETAVQFRQEKAVLGKEAKLHNQTTLPMPVIL